ncbi:Dot/Icm T4SS effector, partial [Sesbania bispinosa]
GWRSNYIQNLPNVAEGNQDQKKEGQSCMVDIFKNLGALIPNINTPPNIANVTETMGTDNMDVDDEIVGEIEGDKKRRRGSACL